MKVVDAYGLVITGAHIRYLMSVQTNSLVGDVERSFKHLTEQLEVSEFPVTLAFVTEFLKKFPGKLARKRKSETIGGDICKMILEEAFFLEKTFLSEAKTKSFYSLPRLRYTSTYLIECPEKFLRPDAFQKLSEMARFDFTSACRCLVYGESTASAFHILRATEETLRHYYFHYVKTKRLRRKDQTWGGMTHAMRARKSKKPPQLILDALDLVRTGYRNPTQHPEVKYDIEQAQDLLGLCIDLINKMVAAI